MNTIVIFWDANGHVLHAAFVVNQQVAEEYFHVYGGSEVARVSFCTEVNAWVSEKFKAIVHSK